MELLPCSPTSANEYCNIDVHSSSNVGTTLVATDFWTLHSNGSKTRDVLRAGCILIDPDNKRYILSCHLEFKCTKNIVEYEALVFGLNKAIDLKVEVLKVIGDSNIVTHQVRAIIHCVSPNLRIPKRGMETFFSFYSIQ